MATKTRACVQCGGSFESIRSNHKCCSKTCQGIRYRTVNDQAIRDRKKAWWLANRERLLERNRENNKVWYAKNRERICAARREARMTRKTALR